MQQQKRKVLFKSTASSMVVATTLLALQAATLTKFFSRALFPAWLLLRCGSVPGVLKRDRCPAATGDGSGEPDAQRRPTGLVHWPRCQLSMRAGLSDIVHTVQRRPYRQVQWTRRGQAVAAQQATPLTKAAQWSSHLRQ